MGSVQPTFKKMCLETVFRDVTSENYVLIQLKKTYTKIHLRGSPKRLKEIGETALSIELEGQAHTKLVEMLKIKLTMPEDVVFRQEDKPEDDPLANEAQDSVEENVHPQPRMYFVAKGKYDVYIKTNHGVSVKKYSPDMRREKPDRIL